MGSEQETMFRTAAYGLALLYAFVNVPMDQQACKAQFLLVLACLDSLLLFGHLWDRVPSLQVIPNWIYHNMRA